MDILNAVLECFTGSLSLRSTTTNAALSDEETEERLACDIVDILFNAEKPSHVIEERLNGIVHTEGWWEGLAKRVLHHLVHALKAGKAMGHAMQKKFDRATNEANDFIHRHPVFTAVAITVVAIGILVLLAPWVVEALGFGELGPEAGSWAAFWQSTFPDAEAGSFFSYLQRLGMKWGRK